MQPYDQPPHASSATLASARSRPEIDEGLRAFMVGVYDNMVIGLALSAVVALGINKLAVAGSQADAVALIGGVPLTALGRLLYTTPLTWLVALAPLAFGFFFSARFDRLPPMMARTTFFLFAGLMGASFSTLLIRYAGASVVQVFFITAAAFGSLSLWGYTTQRSISGIGSFLMMGLIGLIVASLVNIFLASSAIQFAISGIGVLIFAGLTAYDTQKLKEIYLLGESDPDGTARASISGALTLYLDFVNMFQFLLSLFGTSRSQQRRT